MQVALVEPYFSGSHKGWAIELQKHSTHEVHLFTLPGRHWKWRMHAAAITLATKINESDKEFDLIFATDMMDLALFKSLLSKVHRDIPLLIYFHENQLTYPWSEQDPDAQKGRPGHYQFINYTSALVADRVFFNSEYHRKSFTSALPDFLKSFPDHNNVSSVKEIEQKSAVIPIGLDLTKFGKFKPATPKQDGPPIILWNHRWEYDKNPEDFFKVLFELKAQKLEFRLVVMGAHFKKSPKIFSEARLKLEQEIVHWGYCNSFDEYAKWLWESDILPVTSIQDFFGISIVEAIHCECIPVLPNRLSYPEHVSDYSLFYDTSDELIKRLKQVIESGYRGKKEDLIKGVERYNWRHAIKDYDQNWAKSVGN